MARLSWLLSRRIAAVASIALWCLAIGGVAALAWTDRQPNLRHPAVVTSADLVVALIASGWCLMIAHPRTIALARLLWTLGVVTLLLHILLAFWLAHRWSHEAAVEHVREVGGSGVGIVANYLFALVWLADGAWWWMNPVSRAGRPRLLGWAIHGFLAFIVVNATVVFGEAERRLVSAAFFAALGAVALVLSGRGAGNESPIKVPRSRTSHSHTTPK